MQSFSPHIKPSVFSNILINTLALLACSLLSPRTHPLLPGQRPFRIGRLRNGVRASRLKLRSVRANSIPVSRRTWASQSLSEKILLLVNPYPEINLNDGTVCQTQTRELRPTGLTKTAVSHPRLHETARQVLPSLRRAPSSPGSASGRPRRGEEVSGSASQPAPSASAGQPSSTGISSCSQPAE